jgi:hypothetical protein
LSVLNDRVFTVEFEIVYSRLLLITPGVDDVLEPPATERTTLPVRPTLTITQRIDFDFTRLATNDLSPIALGNRPNQ